MKNWTHPGMNKTGMATSPVLSRQMLTSSAEPRAGMTKRGDGIELARVRIEYAEEAEPMGTMPPPGSLKELTTATIKAIKGDKAMVLIDKLGERLAFERTGARLYEGILSKLDAFGSWRGGPTREDLEEIQHEELMHFLMLKQAMEELGSDPTAVTPSANLAATTSMGIPAVIADPRTDLRQCLEAILVAELVDNDCWENLIRLATGFDRDDLARRFEQALSEEGRHLRRVRTWVGSAVSMEAFGHVDADFRRAAEAKERMTTGMGPRTLERKRSTRVMAKTRRKPRR